MAALARVAVQYTKIVTSREAERQTSAKEICGIPASRLLSSRNCHLNCDRCAITLHCPGLKNLELAGVGQGEQGDRRRPSQESR